IFSHHGQHDSGSHKVPRFLGARLLHLIDNMDSKMEAMRAHIARDRHAAGVWTGYSAPLQRIALKKQQYLDRTPESVREPSESAANEPVKPAAKEPAPSLFAAKLQGALKSDS